MSRPTRLDLANVTQHVIQRGNNRQRCFRAGVDFICYLQELREITQREGCAVHAYVLMSNHSHLLMTPSAVGQIGRVMQALGRRYVRYVNDRYRRTGTLWEGRYKACLVGDDRHLLQCQRYIELNPVRAGMVVDPADYLWSSHRHHALGEADPLIHTHPTVSQLAGNVHERQRRYRELVMAAIDPKETDAIRRHLQRQHAYGSERFRRSMEDALRRPVGDRKIGRPRKA